MSDAKKFVMSVLRVDLYEEDGSEDYIANYVIPSGFDLADEETRELYIRILENLLNYLKGGKNG